MQRFSYGTTPEHIIEAALNKEGKHYHMELVGKDAEITVKVVNIGIDSHLQAITGSTFGRNGHRLVCVMPTQDMLVYLRRLDDEGSDEAMDLRTSILSTLEIEEI